MLTNRVIKRIINAFQASTIKDNKFRRAIDATAWDELFYVDDEFYYRLPDGTMFITPSLDPFKITRRRPAHFIFADLSGTIDVFENIEPLF